MSKISSFPHASQCLCSQCKQRRDDPEVTYTSYHTQTAVMAIKDVYWSGTSWIINFEVKVAHQPPKNGWYTLEGWEKYSKRWHDYWKLSPQERAKVSF